MKQGRKMEEGKEKQGVKRKKEKGKKEAHGSTV